MARYITEKMCIYDRIKYMIENPNIVNNQGRIKRAAHWQEALKEAADILPDGAMKRGLEYLYRNPEAKLFYIGETDIIKPALQEALRLMEKEQYRYA